MTQTEYLRLCLFLRDDLRDTEAAMWKCLSDLSIDSLIQYKKLQARRDTLLELLCSLTKGHTHETT